MQCILVKSDQFENSSPLLYIFVKSCLCCCSLATLAAQQLWTAATLATLAPQQSFCWRLWSPCFSLCFAKGTYCLKAKLIEIIQIHLLYIELAIAFLIGRKRTGNFRNQRLWRQGCRLYNNHVKVTSNHVKVTGNNNNNQLYLTRVDTWQ